MTVSANFFELLGVDAAVGRTLRPIGRSFRSAVSS